MTNRGSLSDPLRRELLVYLLATSKERATIIGELLERNTSMAELLIDLDADEELRTRLETYLLNR